jgi:hypothetical protein
LHREPIAAGLLVCHKCDNRACVNPDHLFLGTNADNIRDRDRKGRRPVVVGKDHPNSKLTAEAVRDIRARRAKPIKRSRWAVNPDSVSSLAREYGVTNTAILQVLAGTTWRHVD